MNKFQDAGFFMLKYNEGKQAVDEYHNTIRPAEAEYKKEVL
jgi:hypothetical protein